MLPGFLNVPLAIVMLASMSSAQSPSQVEPPPVDEAALALRLVEMTKPSAGERAIILYDPTYYPGITTKLREALHNRGVQTYAIVEETPAMVATYINKDVEHMQREQDVVTTLLPIFRRSDIFYWMPVRGYADDMRWEKLVAESQVRSVHFHWLLPFPGNRTAEQILVLSREREERSLNVDLAEHARKQEKLAAALRGQTLHLTTPGGTDLTIRVPREQWFHFGNGDASRKRAATARSVRDREIELPIGFFIFVPPAESVNGKVVAGAINQAGTNVKDVRFGMRQGLMQNVSAAQGEDWIRERIKDIGRDATKIASVWLYTHPLDPARGVTIEIGSNWEVAEPARRNGATRLRRMSMAFPDATLTAGGRTIVRAGRIVWDEL